MRSGFATDPLNKRAHETNVAHEIFFTNNMRFRTGVYNKAIRPDKWVIYRKWLGIYKWLINSAAANSPDATVIAVFNEISPLTRGRLGLLIRSTGKSQMSFIIILDAMIDCVIAILAKTGPFVKIHKPGFAILAPAIFKMAVGKTFLGRVIDNIALLML